MQGYKNGFRSVHLLTAHIVLVVKYRRKALNNEVLIRLETILKETLEKWESELIEFNGETDHIHFLINYPPKTRVSDLVANLKTVSSRLIRKEFNSYLAEKRLLNALWSGSYFIASCGGVTIEQLRQYVEKQDRPE